MFPGELDLRGSTQHDEARALQKTVSALDREKDALQETVDQKTEKMAVLQEELSRKVSAATTSHSARSRATGLRVPHYTIKKPFLFPRRTKPLKM